MILLGIIIPVLAFFIAINAAYAYFTATTTTSVSSETAQLIINFTDSTNVYADSEIITTSTLLLPGETISASGSVENPGNVQAYTIIKFEVLVTKLGAASSEVIEQHYYTISNSTLTEITENNDELSDTAFVLNPRDSQTFEVEYVLDFNYFDNEYQQATVTYTLQACSIQTMLMTDATEATELLLERMAS